MGFSEDVAAEGFDIVNGEVVPHKSDPVLDRRQAVVEGMRRRTSGMLDADRHQALRPAVEKASPPPATSRPSDPPAGPDLLPLLATSLLMPVL